MIDKLKKHFIQSAKLSFIIIMLLLSVYFAFGTSYESVERSNLNQFGSYSEYDTIIPVIRDNYWFADMMQTNPLEKYIDPNFQSSSYLPNNKNWYNDIISLNSSVNTTIYGVNHARNLLQSNIIDADYNTNELLLLTDYGLMFGIFNSTTERPYFGYGTYAFTPAGVINPYEWHGNVTSKFDVNTGEGNFPILFDLDNDGQMEALYETKEGSDYYLKTLEYNASKTNKLSLKGTYGSNWVVNLTGYLSDDTTGSISCARTPVTDVPSATWECIIVSDHCSLMELWGNSTGFINEAEYFFSDQIHTLEGASFCSGSYEHVNGLIGNVLWNDFVPADTNDGLELAFPYYVTDNSYQKVVMVYYDPQGGIYGNELPQTVELGSDGNHYTSLKTSGTESPSDYLITGWLGGVNSFIGSSGVPNIGDTASMFEMRYNIYNITNLMKIESISVNGDAFVPFLFDKTLSDSNGEMCFGKGSPTIHYVCYSPNGINFYNITYSGTSDDMGETGEAFYSVQQVFNPYINDFEDVFIDQDGSSVLKYNITSNTAHPYFKLISETARCNGTSTGLIQNMITYLDSDWIPDIISLDYGQQILCSATSGTAFISTSNQQPQITVYPVGWTEGICYNPVDNLGNSNIFAIGLNCSDFENDNVSVYIYNSNLTNYFVNFGLYPCNGGQINLSALGSPYYYVLGQTNETKNISVIFSVNESSGWQDYANITVCMDASSIIQGGYNSLNITSNVYTTGDFIAQQTSFWDRLGFNGTASRILLGCIILIMILIGTAILFSYLDASESLIYVIPFVMLLGYLGLTFLGLFPIGLLLVVVLLSIIIVGFKFFIGGRNNQGDL